MPVVVVSDSSPVRVLHHLKLLEVCRELYQTVYLPIAVVNELRTATRNIPAIDLTPYPWLIIRDPHAVPADLGVPENLDLGETQAIGLALELHADLLLIDERQGTHAAERL